MKESNDIHKNGRAATTKHSETAPQKDKALSNKGMTTNPDCPCKRNCVRHGNCKECQAVHKAEGKYPTCCQRIENRKKRKGE